MSLLILSTISAEMSAEIGIMNDESISANSLT